MAAGLPPSAALLRVGQGLGAPLGDSLSDVARALDLGASSEHAWRTAIAVRPEWARVAAAIRHTERSGAALAPALSALADDERRRTTLARTRAARRVGVLAAGPLGLCFLPAFVLIGVVPIIGGLVQQLSIS